MKKDQKSIPTSKIARATKFIQTGVKLGGNYVKHYAKKMVNPELTKDELHEDNAKDIYDTLSQLKGSALKVAQMMSMDKNVLPKAYTDRFTMAQYSAPPLSYPLVVKTFKQNLGKTPTEIFDTFSKEAMNAASIGQVHQATLGGKKLAVKIQYPGVADSIKSDLKMVKPFAVRLLNMNEKDLEMYMGEVEDKLLEEADYELELKRSVEISQACKHFPNLFFAEYYPEYSSKRILTMDWLDGLHLPDFLATNPSQDVRNKIGQALWDFYDYQVHTLRAVHADPHPGNFLLTQEGKIGVIDFGCIKEIPTDYYDNYFIIINPHLLTDEATLLKRFKELDFILEQDTIEQQAFFMNIFKEMIRLLGKPFHTDSFDFGNDDYFQEIYQYAEKLARMEELRKTNQARGSRHGLYINRTYFGLYSMLNQLKANITTTKPEFLTKPVVENV
jgi:predicted unusual protein kinase regulating ubiquinone biosynthesis (AarF/ABC1/UbiB family)